MVKGKKEKKNKRIYKFCMIMFALLFAISSVAFTISVLLNS